MRSSATAALLALGLTTCGEVSPGVDPPADRFAFPSGLLLDPRVPIDEPARWLFVVNGNSDLRYNSGSMVPIDLDAFWAALETGPILDAGATLSADRPCRRVANLPQTIECTEDAFAEADATAFFGNFPGPPTAWDRDPADDEAMLLVPVRGDPSVTWFELSGGLDGDDLRVECGQAGGSSRCDDRHRLRYLRNDPDADRISREPFRVHVSGQADLPYAYVSHALVGQFDGDLTLIDLDGLPVDGDGLPAITDDRQVFAGGLAAGGFGLAQRPCDVESGNAPASSLGCARPRIYGALRWQLVVQVSTVVAHEPLATQSCVGPDDLDQTGGILCDAQIEPIRRFLAGGLPIESFQPSLARPLLADLEFSADGDELYVVQSNPGGLLRIDTSLDENDDEPRDVAVGQVEVCAQPTSLAIYDDGDRQLGLVTCYRTAELFVVELGTLSVVGLVRCGTGPDSMAIDLAREVVYVANTLDATVSVVDMSSTRATRFTEIARIGVQEPYTDQ